MDAQAGPHLCVVHKPRRPVFSRPGDSTHTILIRTRITKTRNEFSDKPAHLYRLAGAFAALSNTVLDMVKDQER